MSHLKQSLDKHDVWGRHGTYMDYRRAKEGTIMRMYESFVPSSYISITIMTGKKKDG